jgi:hypothetical protein
MGRWRDAALAAGRREREREREESTGEGGRLGLGWLACAARGWRPGAANRAGEEAGRWQVRVIIAGKRGLELDGVGGVGCWCCRPTGQGPAVRRGGWGSRAGEQARVPVVRAHHHHHSCSYRGRAACVPPCLPARRSDPAPSVVMCAAAFYGTAPGAPGPSKWTRILCRPRTTMPSATCIIVLATYHIYPDSTGVLFFTSRKWAIFFSLN